MKKHTLFLAIVLLVVSVLFIYRFLDVPRRYEHTFYPMGGIPCRVVLYGTLRPADNDFEAIEKRVEDLEKIFNRYRSNSEVSKLSNMKANSWHQLSSELYRGIEESLKWYGKSGGAFDITVQPLSSLWKKAAKDKRLPSKKDIDLVLKSVGSSKLTLSPESGIKFSDSKMELDLGGIAKGYILDQMANVVKKNGIDKYVISCGGDVVMNGKPTFRVGVQEPGKKKDSLMMVLNIPSSSVVTSGHYERYSQIEGKRYSHIIDPRSGRPVSNDLVSVTVIGPDATDSDALATAIAVMGFDEAKKLLEKSDEFKVVLLLKDKDGFKIFYSKELSGDIEFKGKWVDVPKFTM